MRRRLLVVLGVLAALIGLVVGLGQVKPAPAPVHAARLRGADTRPQLTMLFGGTPSAPNPGEVLNTSNGTWLNTPSSFTYQWEDCDSSGNNCFSILGATSASYTIVSGDIGDTIRSTVGACNIYGCVQPSPASTSSQTGLVATAGTAPTNATPPSVSGVPVLAQVLTAATGTWSNTPTSFTYQWKDCDSAGSSCANVATGGTSSTYTVAAADEGSTLEVAVTATNANGSSSPVSSSATNTAAASSLGKTSIGGTCTNGLASNLERANEYTLASQSTAYSVNAYLKPGAVVGSQQIKGIIYADNGSSAPGALEAVTSAITLTNASATGWYSFPMTATTLPAGSYWIGLFSGASSGIIDYCYDTGVGNVDATLTQTFTSGPANPFGTPSFNTNLFSTYIGYTAGTAGTPTAPTSLTATAGDTTASLSWTASTETGGTIDHYQVFRSTSPTSGFAQIGTSTSTTYSDTGLTDGTTYYWFIKAVDALSVVSGQSNTANATPASGSTASWNPTFTPTCGGTTFWPGGINPAVGTTTSGMLNTCVTDPSAGGTLTVAEMTSTTQGISWNGVKAISATSGTDVYVLEPVQVPTSFPCAQTSTSGFWVQLMKVYGQPGVGAPPLSLQANESSTGCSTWGIDGQTTGIRSSTNKALYTTSTTVNDGLWHDWIFHLVMSNTASTGELQAWEDGNAITFNACTNSTTLTGCGSTTLHYPTIITNTNDTSDNYVDMDNSRTNSGNTTAATAFYGPPAVGPTYASVQNTLQSYPNGP